jgi:selenobiotic family peptide radical SAM maturase
VIRDGGLFGRAARQFTLQWHLTNRCGGSCRHCYDRSARGELALGEALRVLADFAAFCRRRRVRGHVTLAGGDPLHYPHFWPLYEAVAQARLPVSILGNPVDAACIDRLMGVAAPAVYQVSLEGLRAHDDVMRGEGHFARTLQFLRDARAAGLTTHVMLTLTRENMGQVLALGRRLRGLTSRFTFNRLAQVGQGADLALPEPARYRRFLARYLLARRANPVLGAKENLFSAVRREWGLKPLPGCTGFGCGAAFNFVALLPDGEVHACRKFPSLIGDIRRDSLAEILASPEARRYRARPQGCRGCPLARHCGGCMAVAFGRGLDPLAARDPFCWRE